MRIRNISGEDRDVPWLGKTVAADAVTDVPDDLAEHFLAADQTWEAAEPAHKKNRN